LQKKEKEINKILFERDAHAKAEDDLKKNIYEMKIKQDELIKKNQDLEEMAEFNDEERKHMENELKTAETLIDRLQRTLKLKEDTIMELHKNRSDFENEMGSVTQHNFNIDPNKFSFKRLKIPDRREVSNSPERLEFNYTQRDELSCKKVCKEAMKILGVENTKDFYSKLLHLRQYHSKYKKSKKLIDKISDMIVQCSPSGSFNKQPNSHQIWRWIMRLLEEYMKIKQSVTGESFSMLCSMLETDDIGTMVTVVSKLLKQRNKS
jgi:chromosome segregation ATPase